MLHSVLTGMLVVVSLYELYIPHAHSLKEKRMVVKSLRDKLRNRFEIAANEVALQDVHQRARLATCFIAHDNANADAQLERIEAFIVSNAEGTLTGSSTEKLEFDETVNLGWSASG